MVRGFALFGVLLINMMNFGALGSIWIDPIDGAADWAQRFFFEMKSWRLFSMLFGLGFTLQMFRAEARGTKFFSVYLRRLAVLFVIGMGHALIYRGDILMYYAQLGLILVLFRHLSPRTLLVICAVLLSVHPVERAVSNMLARSRGEAIVTARPRRTENPEAVRRKAEERSRTHPYAVGSVGKVMAVNAETIPHSPLTDLRGPESVTPLFAMFVLGLYVGRRRIPQDLAHHLQLIKRVLQWGLPFGLAAMTVDWIYRDIWIDPPAPILALLLRDLLWAYGATALSLSYAAAIILLAQREGWKRIVSPLGAVGRLALTVYLTQSIMFGMLFYGFAFGQYYKVGPAGTFGYAIVFFGVQIVACAWWVRRFRFGPTEWVWRSLTYMRVQPFRLAGR